MSLQKLLTEMEAFLRCEKEAVASVPVPANGTPEARRRNQTMEKLEATLREFREQYRDGDIFRRILVAVDDTKPAGWAVTVASNLARLSEARIALVHVIRAEMELAPDFAIVGVDLAESHRQAGLELLHRAQTLIPAGVSTELLLREGEAPQQIVAAARDWDADIIVLGTHGRGPVAHMLLGSTAESVVRHAHRPVLTVGRDPGETANHRMAQTVGAASVAGDPVASTCASGRTTGRIAIPAAQEGALH